MHFGSYSHDGIVSITNVAMLKNNKYLPPFAITTSGSMPILPTFWLTQMGYSITILPFEKGFQIADPQSKRIMYEGKQSKEKFHFVPWDFLEQLTPTSRSRSIVPSEGIYSNVNFMQYTEEVCVWLDTIEHRESMELHCNATKKERNHIHPQIIQDVRESHSRLALLRLA